jgi:hypothetical protein
MRIISIPDSMLMSVVVASAGPFFSLIDIDSGKKNEARGMVIIIIPKNSSKYLNKR